MSYTGSATFWEIGNSELCKWLEWRNITSGIPQGSVLGPILFLIFINDMLKVIQCLVKLFADDAKLFQILKCSQDRHELQDDIGNSKDWSIIWKLLFNIKKCKHLHLGSITTDSRYFMPSDTGNVMIEKVEEEKDLGVIIDSNLNFRQHIASKVSKAIRKSGYHLPNIHLFEPGNVFDPIQVNS